MCYTCNTESLVDQNSLSLQMNCIVGQSQSWGFMSRSTARVIMGQVLGIAYG